VPSTAAARTAVVSLPYRPTQTLTPQDGAGGVIITMSHASQQDRAKSPRRYKEEPAPVAAQLVSASLFTQLHDRCLPTQTRYPLAFRSSCMHQPSSAHRCCVNAAYRAILVTPAHARFWLHGRPSRQAAGSTLQRTTSLFLVAPCPLFCPVVERRLSLLWNPCLGLFRGLPLCIVVPSHSSPPSSSLHLSLNLP